MTRPTTFQVLLILACLALPPRAPGAADLVTEFERSNGRRTASHAETMEYIARLDRASDWIRATTFGVTPEGRALPLVIADRRGRFTPDQARRDDHVVVLIQAGIHSGEIDGKDAGLMLLREIAVDRSLASLLDHVTVLFIPIYNVDGHERVSPYNRANQNGPENTGFRVTANNLNLNRDYLKADAPETRAWLDLFNAWQPDMLVDCHVTDGADFQHVVTYAVETWPTTDPGVAGWSANVLVPALETRMRESGFPLAPYGDFRRAHDPRSGMTSGPYPPRFSTGYAALRSRPALLIETHMFKDYATRVRGTHAMLRHVLALANEQHDAITGAVAAADANTASAAFRREPLPVSLSTSFTDSVMIDFLGYEYTVEKSDVTGGDWHRYRHEPRTYRIPVFSRARVNRTVALPEAYVIPPQWTEVIARVRAHGIPCRVLERTTSLPVRATRFRDVTWKATPFEGHHTLDYGTEGFDETREFVAGSVVVDLAHPLARVAANLLEPEAADALVRWGLFDPVFEQKEYIESYVLEGVIREMLAANPALAREFAAAKADSAFAADPERIRTWFYDRSPYADARRNVYPVARITDRALLDSLPLSPAR
jgi:hypothetical protein